MSSIVALICLSSLLFMRPLLFDLFTSTTFGVRLIIEMGILIGFAYFLEISIRLALVAFDLRGWLVRIEETWKVQRESWVNGSR